MKKYAKYSSDLKEAIALEYKKGVKSIAMLAEEDGISKNTVASWIRLARQNSSAADEGKLIEVTNALGEISSPPEIIPEGMVRFRINVMFEIEMPKTNLPGFLEAMKDATGK